MKTSFLTGRRIVKAGIAAAAAGLLAAATWAVAGPVGAGLHARACMGPGSGPPAGAGECRDGWEPPPGAGPDEDGRGPRGRGPRGGGPLGRLDRMAGFLGLTPEQRAQVRGIIKDAFPSMKPLIEKQAEGRERLSDAIHAEKVDEAAIRRAAADLASSGADLAVARAQVAAKIRTVLTPEQIRMLREHREKMEKRREIRREFFLDHAEEIIETL